MAARAGMPRRGQSPWDDDDDDYDDDARESRRSTARHEWASTHSELVRVDLDGRLPSVAAQWLGVKKEPTRLSDGVRRDSG